MPEAKKKVAKTTKPEAKKEKAPLPKVNMDCQYVAGSYNPKAAHNIKSYDEVLACLPATYKEIQEVIPEHTDFVGYLIRRGGLTEA